MKFIVIVGTINYDGEDGEALLADTLPKTDACGRSANALVYCKRLPVLLIIMKVINFFRGVSRWFNRGLTSGSKGSL